MRSVSELLARVPIDGDQWLPSSLATVAFAAAATALLLYRLSSMSSKTVDLPSPETTLPVLGNTLDTMKKQKSRLYDWFSEESLRHGGKPWQLRIIGRPRSIIITSPKLFEDVLSTQHHLFPKGELSCFMLRDYFGGGILAVDGDEWHFQRKTASHLFSLQMMKDVMSDVIQEKVKTLHDVLLAHSTSEATSAKPMSFRRAITHFTSDVFVKIGFGVELDCLKRSLDGDDENEFITAFSYCAQVLRLRLQQPVWLWRLKRYFGIGEEGVFKHYMEIIDKTTYDIIGKSVANKSSGSVRPAKDLISLFSESKVDEPTAKEWREDEELTQIRDMAINFIFAGKDTTSNSMSWFIVMMNRYPHVAHKIREEIRAKMPSLMTGGLKVPGMDDLKHLTYLEAAIRENLRLNPAVATTSRAAMTTTTLCDGTVVYAGERLALSPYASARQTSVWGEDAAEFKPERWIDSSTGQLITVSPFKFIPFLAGPRICIGRKFAMMEMKIALVVLMARFDFKTEEDPSMITYEIAVTCPVNGPLMVTTTPLAQ